MCLPTVRPKNILDTHEHTKEWRPSGRLRKPACECRGLTAQASTSIRFGQQRHELRIERFNAVAHVLDVRLQSKLAASEGVGK